MPKAFPTSGAEPRSPLAAPCIVGASLIAGVYLSLRGLGGVQLFGDEYHSVRNLAMGYGELAGYYDAFGSGLLLPLLQRAAVDLFGAGPIVYRLPAVLGALGTLLLVFPCGRRLVGSTPALLATLALATSSIHVFYSRTGRAYSLATCLGLAFTLALLRLCQDERPRRRWWLAACVSGALLPYAHLFAATFGAGTALAAVGSVAVARRKGVAGGVSFGSLSGALVAGALLCGALYLPARESLAAFYEEKAFAGSGGPFGPLDVAALLFGGRTAGLVALLAAPPAVVALARACPRRGAMLAAAAFVPAAALLVSRPPGLPYAYARYVLPSLPFLFMALAWLVVAAVGRAPLGRWRAPVSWAVGLAGVALLAWSGPLGREPADGPFANSNLNLMPLPAFDRAWPKRPAFYERLAGEREVETIVEAPELWNRSCLLYRNHWLGHGKRVLLGFVWEGNPERIPKGSTVDLRDSTALAEVGAEYLVLHANVYAELSNYWAFATEEWERHGDPTLDPFMAAHSGYGMAKDRSEQLRAVEERLRVELGAPVYEDQALVVWRLRGRE